MPSAAHTLYRVEQICGHGALGHDEVRVGNEPAPRHMRVAHGPLRHAELFRRRPGQDGGKIRLEAATRARTCLGFEVALSAGICGVAVSQNDSIGRVRYQLLEKMLQPCGPPPEKEADE